MCVLYNGRLRASAHIEDVASLDSEGSSEPEETPAESPALMDYIHVQRAVTLFLIICSFGYLTAPLGEKPDGGGPTSVSSEC